MSWLDGTSSVLSTACPWDGGVSVESTNLGMLGIA